jgi:predicted DNA binding CopG/RHH family protein
MSKLVSKNKQLILESSSELSNIDKDTNDEEEEEDETTDLKDYEFKKSIGKFDEEKNCRDENYYSNECNKFLLKKELK